MEEQHVSTFRTTQSRIEEILTSEQPPLPSPEHLTHAFERLNTHLPDNGKGLETTINHILQDLVPGFSRSGISPTFYGFVTGGSTPAAKLADNIVTCFDPNVQVYLPQESIAETIEDVALRLLLELFSFEVKSWPARCFTTGATASNVMGLACGREYVVSEKLRGRNLERQSGEGLLSACRRAGIDDFQILTTLPHSSLGKAANIVGIGSTTIVDVSAKEHFLRFDLIELEEQLAKPNTASLVVISCGEVNTGEFATTSVEAVRAIRDLCDKYGAWLHVDAAFGIFARLLPDIPEYSVIRNGTAGLELADSIGGDGHKLLNVPYDCGFFYSRHRDIPARVFQNTNAAYLSGIDAADSIPSPLNIRIENSARFRGLPVYATLVTYGRAGYEAMIVRMVALARRIAKFIAKDCPHLELLPSGSHLSSMESIFMCVLFRAKDEALNESLTQKIKDTRKVYGSGTKWEGKPATRFAIAKWSVDVDRDFEVVKEVLTSII